MGAYLMGGGGLYAEFYRNQHKNNIATLIITQRNILSFNNAMNSIVTGKTGDVSLIYIA